MKFVPVDHSKVMHYELIIFYEVRTFVISARSQLVDTALPLSVAKLNYGEIAFKL